MQIYATLEKAAKQGMEDLYQISVPVVEFQSTVKDFEGDLTIVVFPFLKYIKGNPFDIGTKLGNYLKENIKEVEKFNVVKGFLNISLTDTYYLNSLNQIRANENFGVKPADKKEKSVMVEYSSPNTNKPLHLGHIRNNLLGYSVSQIIAATGKKVYKTQIINDRGIHICKSMIAWKKFGFDQTPSKAEIKGDKFVGNFYVKFDQEYKKEIKTLMDSGLSEDEAKKNAPIMLEAQDMLRKWEAGDAETLDLWKKMNEWVYEGFNKTYKDLGVAFDINYFESDTYLLGKDIVREGLKKGVFFQKSDGSVWIDLTEDGLDEKIVQRSDGTAVYMTQDIGTAVQRIKDYTDIDTLVYTVGNEQDYHFKVLFLILKKLGFPWAENLYHLSYGMVDLPSGKMKSREGTVVDADDLIQEMTDTAREISQELGKLEGYSEEEKEKLYRIIGMGALKYYILKVDPKKRILFDPKESIDFNGNTGPFIQYTYARIQSILRKAAFDYNKDLSGLKLHEKEREIIQFLEIFPEAVLNAALGLSPAIIANYTYDLVKAYNSFYQTVPILGSENMPEKILRIQISEQTGKVLKTALSLLGIEVPERM
jgi:arginyl-tRNA synthetase